MGSTHDIMCLAIANVESVQRDAEREDLVLSFELRFGVLDVQIVL